MNLHHIILCEGIRLVNLPMGDVTMDISHTPKLRKQFVFAIFKIFNIQPIFLQIFRI